MQVNISPMQLQEAGLSNSDAEQLLQRIQDMAEYYPSKSVLWNTISKELLSTSHYPFAIHKLLFSSLYPHEPTDLSESPAWAPDDKIKQTANITRLMSDVNKDDVQSLHKWSTENYQEFWTYTIKQLDIRFKKAPASLVDLSQGIESPVWLPDARLNISDSCFTAPGHDTAIICPDLNGNLEKISYDELNTLSNQIANSLIDAGMTAGDKIGIIMPMNIHAVAIYLGIIKMGGIVVSIADSFSTQEILTRLKITSAKAVFTQDLLQWSGKTLPLYQKVFDATRQLAHTCKIIMLPIDQRAAGEINPYTIHWDNFISQNRQFESCSCSAMTAMNILFSSGTTSEPKAIVWNHSTPIKAASDAYYHQNIKPRDVLAWPTNLGWMMGPWLIFAALINKATIALYPEAPKDKAFGQFVQDAKVTMLGVVPTLVATWRETQCMETLDWSAIKVFSSTGECSNPADMLYLMSLAGYKPVIEYCGGTEIGGAYISSTVVEPNYPSVFTTPTLGMNFMILDETGKQADIGEVAIIPPSIGLSTQLLNADHHHVYFENMPASNQTPLRRHGDQLKRFQNGMFCILGRVDDTMNLGGIKVSAAEIERAVAGVEGVLEAAAIAVTSSGNGPGQLIIYAVLSHPVDKAILIKQMQKRINQFLNPLFKIADIMIVQQLPKTASNKIMRRKLRS